MDAKLKVDGGIHAYQIYLRHEAQIELTERLMSLRQSGTFVVLSDENVARLYAGDFVKGMTEKGMDAHLITVGEGERSKSLEVATTVYESLVQLGADRQTVLIGFGGGVVGDLAGFVAATYMRGMPFVQVPTTLLAQVDSSVGGKVGLNLPQGKNLVGAFYEPEFVWLDTAYLDSLSDKQIRNGFAEVVKHALIGQPALLDDLEAEVSELKLGNTAAWRRRLRTAIQVKIDVVQQDFRESGIRRSLNFGHTLAHAIEASGDFHQFNHGEAVSLGMRAMLRLSVLKGSLNISVAHRSEKILDEIGFPQLELGMLSDETLNFIKTDKKKNGESYRLIFLKSLGQIEEVTYTWDELKLLFGSLREHPTLET